MTADPTGGGGPRRAPGPTRATTRWSSTDAALRVIGRSAEAAALAERSADELRRAEPDRGLRVGAARRARAERARGRRAAERARRPSADWPGASSRPRPCRCRRGPAPVAPRHHRRAARGAVPARRRDQHQPRAAHAAGLDQAAGRDALRRGGRGCRHRPRLRGPDPARGRPPGPARRRAARPVHDRIGREHARHRAGRPRRGARRRGRAHRARRRAARCRCPSQPEPRRGSERSGCTPTPARLRPGPAEPRPQRGEVQPAAAARSGWAGSPRRPGCGSGWPTTGSASPLAHQQRIFERFYKVDRSRARRARRRARDSAGQRRPGAGHRAPYRRGARRSRSALESEEGVGSTFWIEVPRAPD